MSDMDHKNSVRAVTARILASDGNLIKLVLSVLVFIVILLTPIFFSSAAYYVFGSETSEADELAIPIIVELAVLLITLAIYVFLLLPMIAAIYKLARKIVKANMKECLPDSYFRDVFLGFVSAIGIAFPVAVLAGGIYVCDSFCRFVVSMQDLLVKIIVFLFLACFVVMVFLFSLYLSSVLFYVPEIILGGETIPSAIKKSFLLSRENRADIIKHELFCIALTAVSILTLGVAFVLYVAPFIAVSYFVLVNKKIHLSCSDSRME